MIRRLVLAFLLPACVHVVPPPPRDVIQRRVVARSSPVRPGWLNESADVITGKEQFVGEGYAASLETARSLAEADLLASIAGVVTATSGTVVRGVEIDQMYWERYASPLATGGDVHQVFVRGWAQQTELARARYLVRQRRREATGRILVAVLPFDGAPQWRFAIRDAVSRALDLMEKVETVDDSVIRAIAPNGTADPDALRRVRRAVTPDFLVTGGFAIAAGRLRLTLVLRDAEGKAIGVVAYGRPRQQISGALYSAIRRLASRILNRSSQSGLRISSKALEQRGRAAALLEQGDPEEALKRAVAAIEASPKNVDGWMIAARILEEIERPDSPAVRRERLEPKSCTQEAEAAIQRARAELGGGDQPAVDASNLRRFAEAVVDLVSFAPWKGRRVPLRRNDQLRRSPVGGPRRRIDRAVTAEVLEEDASRRWLLLRADGGEKPVEGWYSKRRMLRRLVPKPPKNKPASAAEAYYAAFRAAKSSDPKRYGAAIRMARMAASLGHHELSRDLYRAIAEAFPSLDIRARALLGLGKAEARLGRLEAARGALVRARALALTLGATVHLLEVNRLLARLHAARGEPEQALAFLRPLIAMAETLDDSAGADGVRAEIGALLAATGETMVAEDNLRRAYAGHPTAATAIGLAAVAMRRGEVALVEDLLGDAEARASVPALRAALARARGIAAIRKERAGRGIPELARAATLYGALASPLFRPTEIQLHEAELLSSGERPSVRRCVVERLRRSGAPSAVLLAETTGVATAGHPTSTPTAAYTLDAMIAEPTAPIALSPRRLRGWGVPEPPAAPPIEVDRMIENLRRENDPLGTAGGLLGLAQALWLEQRYETSYRTLMQAKGLYARADDLLGVALTLRWLATLFEESGASELAARHRALARRLTD